MTSAHVPEPPTIDPRAPLARRARRRHLVIADDSAEMRRLIRGAIGRQFDDVIEVADGRALFWAILRASVTAHDKAAPELVLITDVAMPAYDGLEVIDAWHDVEQDIPTIVITAFPSETVRARAQALGVFLLAKPFSIAQLRQVVHDRFDVARDP